jgi:hypothetical protein
MGVIYAHNSKVRMTKICHYDLEKIQSHPN